jgi:hypothetical protein
LALEVRSGGEEGVGDGQVAIPRNLRERAFQATNGELAWEEGDALRVVDFAEQSGIAVLGGEVWFITKDGAVMSLFRSRDGSEGLYEWSTREVEGEAKIEFVGRCAQDSRDAISAFRRKVDMADETARPPFFNLTFDRDVE